MQQRGHGPLSAPLDEDACRPQLWEQLTLVAATRRRQCRYMNMLYNRFKHLLLKLLHELLHFLCASARVTRHGVSVWAEAPNTGMYGLVRVPVDFALPMCSLSSQVAVGKG